MKYLSEFEFSFLNKKILFIFFILLNVINKFINIYKTIYLYFFFFMVKYITFILILLRF